MTEAQPKLNEDQKVLAGSILQIMLEDCEAKLGEHHFQFMFHLSLSSWHVGLWVVTDATEQEITFAKPSRSTSQISSQLRNFCESRKM